MSYLNKGLTKVSNMFAFPHGFIVLILEMFYYEYNLIIVLKCMWIWIRLLLHVL